MNNIISLYNSGLSRLEIGKRLNISDWHIRKFLLNNGITLRGNEGYKKFTLDETVFEPKNLNEVATYFLGFLMADACIDKHKALRINLAVQDIEILEGFKRFIKTDARIRHISRKQKSNGATYESNLLVINSVKIVADLAMYGLVPHKSGNEKISELIPSCYIRDYIRGYFDGDGFVGYYKIGEKIQYCLDVVSQSEQIISQIFEYLGNKFIIKQDKTVYRLKSFSRYNIISFYNHIYYPGCVCLNRKLVKFQEIMEH